MESLISLQSLGMRSIGEPTAPRPNGVQQGSVLVVLDVNKAICPTALYWAIGNVVRKGDNLKILGIITHLANTMGFMMRIDQSTWSSNILELQYEIAMKKEAILNIAFIQDWCLKAGGTVKLDVDVKAGANPKVIAVDESKSIGAYHVVLDKNMKKDKKYFIENLTCFVSRARNSGGVDTIRSFAVSSKLPPMAPTTPKGQAAPHHSSKPSNGSTHSHRGSSMSSTSFELGEESCDDFVIQDSDHLSAPSTGESIDRPLHENGSGLLPPIRSITEQDVLKNRSNLYNLLRGPVLEGNGGCSLNNPLRKPAIRKWLNEEEQLETPRFEHGPLTFRGDQRSFHQGSSTWIGHLNVAPELGQSKVGRQALTATLRTQASFNNCRKQLRTDKINMDVYWPIMHWADCRGLKRQYSSGTSLAGATVSNFLGVRRRPIMASGLNYSDMVESD